MVCASRLAQRLGRIPPDATRRQQVLLKSLGLPVAVPQFILERPNQVLDCMLLDKKTESRQLRFVLPSRIGHVEVVKAVENHLVLESLAEETGGITPQR
jgi:3-dehydroquinate synthase